MASILEKLGLIVKGNIHDLLDKVIDWNSISALKQYARELETAIDDIEDEVAVAEGSANTAHDTLLSLESKLSEIQTNIDFILGDGDDANDHLAEPLMARQITLEEQRESAEQEVETYRTTMQEVGKVASALNTKLESSLAQIRKLEGLKNVTAAKNRASGAVKLAERLSATNISVDNLGARIVNEANIADARLRRALGNIQTNIGQDTLVQEAKARLAARKAELQKKKTGGKKTSAKK